MKLIILAAIAALGLASSAQAQPRPGGPLPPPPPPRCGGIAGLHCPGGLYCSFAPGTCGASDQMGVCRPRPQVCYKIYSPVCGCDGHTYANACEAAAAGRSLSHPGRCQHPLPPGAYTQRP